MEVVPLSNITAESTAKSFYEQWINRFSIPSCVITDKGTQFTSELFRSLISFRGVKLSHMTSYDRTQNYSSTCDSSCQKMHI